MVEIKDNDFVKVNFDIYANSKLVNSTNEKKGKEANLQEQVYGPQTIVIGKAFVLKALDEAVKKKEKGTLELSPEEAYGKRQKELIKTFPKSSFDEHKLRAVVGVTYDFNGMFGTVKSVVGGRVMVDFNNPLSGKDIKLEYSVVEKVTNISEKIKVVMESVLRIPSNMFEVSANEKIVTLKVPKQLVDVKQMFEQSLNEMISDLKDYTLKIEIMPEKVSKK